MSRELTKESPPLVLAPVDADHPLAAREGALPAVEPVYRLGPPREVIDETVAYLRRIAFLVCVVVPMTIATIYFAFVAADLYVSETRFFVRQGGQVDAVSGTLGSVLQSSGIETTSEGSWAVKAFVESRDIVDRLVQENELLARLDRPEADMVMGYSTFWRPKTSEALYRHFARFVDLTIDKSTGISTLSVRAFRPQDARDLSFAILGHAEALVNRLNDRAIADAISFAEDLVARNETRVKAIQDQLTAYRNRELVVDPAKQSTAALELNTRLSMELAQIDTALSKTQASSPSNPQIADMKARRAALRAEIDKQKKTVVGADSSLAGKLAAYEKISLEKELAVKALTSSLVSLERARQDAIIRKLYIERIVEPNLSDKAEFPRRGLILGGCLLFFLSLYWVVRWLIDLALEHMR